MTHLRGEIRGRELTETEHDMLYQRALTGSRKEAAAATGEAHGHHTMSRVLAKLGVEDITSAYAAMGWLRPLPYGVSAADRRHEDLLWAQGAERVMGYTAYLHSPVDVTDTAALQAAFADAVARFDSLGEPCEGFLTAADDRGDNPTEHIRPTVNGFSVSAAAVRAELGRQP